MKGIFKFIIHDHYFEAKGDAVMMTDVFKFRSPFGLIGRIVDKILLNNYLKRLLIQRNSIIKEFAETSKGKAILDAR